MTDPGKISILDYTYPLPDERIARYPLAERDASRLLVYRNSQITNDHYRNLPVHIPPNARLVFNNTKVVEARLIFRKPSGGLVEIFCLEPHEEYPDITRAMRQTEQVRWHCLVGGASKWKPGQLLEKKIDTPDLRLLLRARYIEKRSGSFLIELSWTPAHLSFAEVLHLAGAIPLPPYLKRAAETSDTERYQTVYANRDGSVAAPTAGLHFTENILTQLKQRNTGIDFVTLHVGAGTFKPVKSERMQEHEMHAEWMDVSRETIENILQHQEDPIVAVGTTSMRTLESLYWLGVKILRHPTEKTGPGEILALDQWEAYSLAKENVSVREAFEALLTRMKLEQQEQVVAKTQLLIAPGYIFRVIKGLITNFHQPQSTLLLLVAALIGDDWRKVYDHALAEGYRFLSYGDGSLLWKNDT
ncbi:MAG: S-adenosylmethionine:tRNA ribosyltransferase-isomerase [Chitinophagaceae bacterium]